MADEQPEAPAPEAPAAPQPPKAKRKKIPKEKDEIRLCSHSKFLYTWPLILVAFLLPLLNRMVSVNCGTWAWIITAIIVGTCVLADWNNIITLLIGVFAFAVSMVVLVATKLWEIPFFVDFYHWLIGLPMPDMTIPAIILSCCLAGGLLKTEFQARVTERYRFKPNLISRLEWAGGEEILSDGKEYPQIYFPDMLEMILGFGAGTIKIKNALTYVEEKGGADRKIKNVPFLLFRRKRIIELCHVVKVKF